jgi:hypothetical protein
MQNMHWLPPVMLCICSNFIPEGFPSNSPYFLAAPSINASTTMMTRFMNKAAAAGIDYFYCEWICAGV